MKNRKIETANQNKTDVLALLAVWLISAACMAAYLHRAVTALPLMDFWLTSPLWDRLLAGDKSVALFFSTPHTVHWNPLFTFLNNFFFLPVFKFDNRAYIYAGFLFQLLNMALCLFILYRSDSSLKSPMLLLGGVLWMLPLTNLNQWEIFTLYCNFPFMLRVFLFMLTFYLLDRLFHSEKGGWGKTIGLILLGVFAMLFCGQGYLFGLYGAIFCVTVLDLFLIRRKAVLKQQIAILAAFTLAIAYYFATLFVVDLAGSGIGMSIMYYVKGFLIMLGATVMPNNIAPDYPLAIGAVGALILALTVIALIRYFKSGMFRKTYLPLFLLIYAFINILAIEYGRADYFGLISLSSSRYIVETSMGILGLVMIYWDWFTAVWKDKKRCRYFALAAAILFIALNLIDDRIEWRMGRYRHEYGVRMIDIAYNIDTASDDDLVIFQSDPLYVRHGIEVMREHELCIFSPEYIRRNPREME